MAYEIPVGPYSLTAGASQASNQYKFVKLSADDTVILCAADTDPPVGVLQNNPASGDACSIQSFGVTKIKLGGTVAAGDFVGTTSTGLGEKRTIGTDTTKYVSGMALNGGDSGDIVSILLCGAPFRAA